MQSHGPRPAEDTPAKKSKNSHEIQTPLFSRANLELGFSKAALVIPTQGIQVTMRFQQAALAAKENPRVLSAFQAAKEIYQGSSKGSSTTLASKTFLQTVAPFFKGGFVGAGKEGFKNMTYKAPLIAGAPHLADQFLLTPLNAASFLSSGTYHLTQAFTAGLLAATADVGLGGSFDAWATYRATSQGKDATASFVKELKAAPDLLTAIKLANRGFVPAVFKSSIAFTTFFATATPIKKQIKALYGLEEGQSMPTSAILLAAVTSGTLVAVASSPADIAKTQAQMPNSQGKKLIPALLSNYRSYGLVGMTAGLPLKCLMIIAGWGLNFVVTQRDNHTPTPTTPTNSKGIWPSMFQAQPKPASTALSSSKLAAEPSREKKPSFGR